MWAGAVRHSKYLFWDEDMAWGFFDEAGAPHTAGFPNREEAEAELREYLVLAARRRAEDE